jgi:hypothetical protein
MSDVRGLPGSWLLRDVADIELVPVAAGEKVQARSPADDLGAGRERLPVREHDPVFTAKTGPCVIELRDGEPVMLGSITAEQRDTGARHRQGAGPF